MSVRESRGERRKEDMRPLIGKVRGWKMVRVRKSTRER